MRLPSFQLLPAETIGYRAVAMQLTPPPYFLLEMSFLPTSPSPKKGPGHRRAAEEDTEDHPQEKTRISVDEKEPSLRHSRALRAEQYSDHEENGDEANPIECAVPKSKFDDPIPAFCNDRMLCKAGATGRSSRGIPAIAPHLRHPTSPISPARLSRSRGEKTSEDERAKRDAQEFGADSPSLVGIRNDASRKKKGKCSDGSRVHQNLPPRKRQKHRVSEDGTGQFFSASPSPRAGNYASEHGGGERHPTNTTTPTGKRMFPDADGEDLHSEEEHNNSSSSAPADRRGSLHSPLGSDLSHFVGLHSIHAPPIALPNLTLLALQPQSPLWGLGSAVPDVADLASYLQSATPVAATVPGTVSPEGSLLAAQMAGTIPLGVPTTAAVTAAYHQVASALASPSFNRETSWINSVTGLTQLATTGDITANNQIPLQQQPQGITGTTPSPSCTNTGPSSPSHFHAGPLPGDVGAPAPSHRFGDEKKVRAAQQPWKHAHVRLAQPGAGRSTASSPTREQIPADGSRDDPDMYDYLVGQGGHGVHHVGNKRVRDLIQSLMPKFQAASRQQSPSTPPHESPKGKLIRAVIQDVHNHGGTFLQRDSTGTKWVPLPEREIPKKITQRFNEEACGRAHKQKPKKSTRNKS